ncbi:MAG: aminopeptidase P family protein [Candidatus Zixiibacteriota bacterium]|nr:MAG: aminopeptidase P family protein [candidate division Zixibacteria bacterium]
MSLKRINALRQKLRTDNLDGMILTHLDHVRYLIGFTGTAGLLVISPRGADFFTDFRYTDQARKQVKGARVSIVKRDLVAGLKEFPKLNVKNRTYAFSSEHLTVALKEKLQKALPDSLFVPADSVLADLGWVKDKDEITSITKAVEISDLAFERILSMIAPGVRERELAAELEYQMAMLGSEKQPFETIVASGYRSALPHGVASSKKVKKGDFVTFDFGATINGYVSDITRTVVVGKPTQRQKKIYNIVLKAQKAGIRKVKAGVTAKAVDDASRKVIEKAGFGKNFGHGTGHGIGFYVHLGPRVAPESEDKLMVNNVITIEPGIYISGWGGVRIEDDVVVTRTGGKVLNKAPKNLLVL